jgi:exonuclease VII small subunit
MSFHSANLNMGYFESKKKELEGLLQLIQQQKAGLERSITYLKHSTDGQSLESFESQTLRALEKDRAAIRQLARERQLGFPWLAKAYDEYFALQEDGIAGYLQQKSPPAHKAAEIVREYSRLRREAERRAKVAEYIVEYYEYIAPFLIDLREEVDDPADREHQLIDEYSPEEREDAVTTYLTKEEYRRISTAERNQLALSRYWNRPKSNWLIGRDYERFIG